ncbi:putative transmembrane protein [Cryptosporidium felis]|nr:putative transmembrane protein [Cryptosporidium felis]
MSFSRRSSGGLSSSYDGSLGNLTPFLTHSDPLDSKYLSRSMLEITRDVCYNSSKRNSRDEPLGKEFNYVQKERTYTNRFGPNKLNKSAGQYVDGNSTGNDFAAKNNENARRRFSISYVQNPSSDSKEVRRESSKDNVFINEKDKDHPDYPHTARSSYLKEKANYNTVDKKFGQQVANKKMNVYQANQLLCSLLERDPCRLNSSGLYSYNSQDHSYKINTFQDGCKHWYSNNNRELIDPFSDTNNSYIPQYTTNARRAMYELIGASEATRPDPDLSDEDLSLRFVRGTLVVCDIHNKLQLNLVPPIFGYLYKKSDTQFSVPPIRWQKRYVVVHECHLYWFDSESSYRLFGINASRGSVNLILFRAQMDLSHNKRRFSIEFEDVHKSLVFQVCDNSMDRGLWTGAIQAHLKKALEVRHRTGHHIDWKALEFEVCRIRYESGIKGKLWRCSTEAHNRMYEVHPPRHDVASFGSLNTVVWGNERYNRNNSILSTGSVVEPCTGTATSGYYNRRRTCSITSSLDFGNKYRTGSVSGLSDCNMLRKDSINIVGITTCSGTSGTFPGNSRRHSVERQF